MKVEADVPDIDIKKPKKKKGSFSFGIGGKAKKPEVDADMDIGKIFDIFQLIFHLKLIFDLLMV